MKRFIVFVFLLIPFLSTAQDTIALKHITFTSHFIKSQHIPWYVEYNLTPDMLNCDSPCKRTNRFKADPLCPEATSLGKDYAGCGYDRGHNMSAEDNSCSIEDMAECFYFSNMYPQTHQLNAGVWERLEVHERDLAKSGDVLKIYVGWYGVLKTIGTDNVTVPKYCWKAIYNYNTDLWEAYLFPNTYDVSGHYGDFKTTVSEITSRTHIAFTK